MSETRTSYNLKPEEIHQREEDAREAALVEFATQLRHVSMMQAAAAERFLKAHGVTFKGNVDKNANSR